MGNSYLKFGSTPTKVSAADDDQKTNQVGRECFNTPPGKTKCAFELSQQDTCNKLQNSDENRPVSASTIVTTFTQHENIANDQQKDEKKEPKDQKRRKKKKRKKREVLSEELKEAHVLASQLRSDIFQKEGTIATLREKIHQLESKNEELFSRLSAMASANLTDGNANIADLSDDNRPTKLAEQFSELYDNVWTDAYECLNKSKMQTTEEDICMLLLEILVTIYNLSKEKAVEDLQSLVSTIRFFSGDDKIPKDILKHLKDARKKKTTSQISEGKLKEKLRELFQNKSESEKKEVQTFIDKSVKLCWLMTVQDPPVHMDTSIKKRNEKFDGNTHKPYTMSGPLVDFIVWPSLYLCEGGSLLAKGVAQCKAEKAEIAEEIQDISLDLQEKAIVASKDSAMNTSREAANIENDEKIEEEQHEHTLKTIGAEASSFSKKGHAFEYLPPCSDQNSTTPIFADSIKTNIYAIVTAKGEFQSNVKTSQHNNEQNRLGSEVKVVECNESTNL